MRQRLTSTGGGVEKKKGKYSSGPKSRKESRGGLKKSAPCSGTILRFGDVKENISKTTTIICLREGDDGRKEIEEKTWGNTKKKAFYGKWSTERGLNKGASFSKYKEVVKKAVEKVCMGGNDAPPAPLAK